MEVQNTEINWKATREVKMKTKQTEKLYVYH